MYKTDIIKFLESETINRNKKISVARILKTVYVDFENTGEVFKIFKNNNLSHSSCITYFSSISHAIGKISGSEYEQGKNRPIKLSELHTRYNNFYKKLKEEVEKENCKKKISIVEIPIINDTDTNNEKYEKFLLKLFLTYPPLRKEDYMTIDLKFGNNSRNYYKEGVFVFNKLQKVNRKVNIELDKNDRDVFESLIHNKDYLLSSDFNLPEISKKYCGVVLNFQNLRTIFLTRKNQDFENNGKSFHSNLKEMIGICEKMNTTINQFIGYYCRNE